MDRPHVLIVDDQAGDIRWLLDLVTSRGYEVDLATNKQSAMGLLSEVKSGEKFYQLAIFDVMVAIKDLMDMVDFEDASFYEESRDTGIHLCQYARADLNLSEEELPIVCLSVRDDDDVKNALAELGIPLFNRVPQNPNESIRRYIERHLPICKKEKR